MDTIESVFEYNTDLIPLILSVIGGVFALYQWNLSVKNNKAQYVDNLLQKMMDDEEIREFLRMVDYEEEWYKKEFHDVADNPENRHIPVIADRTLFFMNYLCYINAQKIIRNAELKVFEYYLTTLAQNLQVQSYLLDLYQYSLAEKRKFPFEFFLDYCIKNKFIPKEVKDPLYLRYSLMLEQNADDANVPEICKIIRNSFGSRSFLYKCPKCKYCKHYSSEVCDVRDNVEEVYWLLSYNPCESFEFDESRWESGQR